MAEESVKLRIKEELDTAKRRLSAAKLLLERGMLEDAVNRAYYSFFTPLKPCLMFWVKDYKNKFAGQKFAEYFRRAFEMRGSSGYEMGVIFGEEEVQTLVKTRKNFWRKPKSSSEKTLNFRGLPALLPVQLLGLPRFSVLFC